jgi:hypothetical protein
MRIDDGVSYLISHRRSFLVKQRCGSGVESYGERVEISIIVDDLLPGGPSVSGQHTQDTRPKCDQTGVSGRSGGRSAIAGGLQRRERRSAVMGYA